MSLLQRFARWLINRTVRRDADFAIGGRENPYMLRWWITPWSRLYRGIPDERKTLWQRIAALLPGIYRCGKRPPASAAGLKRNPSRRSA